MAIINNDAYRFYNELLKGYQEGDMTKGFDADVNNVFVHSAIHLAATKAPNPFTDDAEASFQYFTMIKSYTKWRSLDVDRRVSRRRLLEAAAKLAALGKENPFMYEIEPVIELENTFMYDIEPVIEPEQDVVSLDALAEAEYKETEAEDIASGTYIPATKKRRFFGIFGKKD